MIVECRRKGPQLVLVRFGPTGGEQDVADVLDRWPGADHDYFKIRTTEDDLYILRYDANDHAWEISVFKEGQQESRTVDSTVD